MTIPAEHIAVDLGPYMIGGFTPLALPPTAVLSTSNCNLGTPNLTDQISSALSVNLGSDSRWVADPAKLTDAGDGTWHWATSAGTVPAAYWSFVAANVCSTNPTYSYKLRRGRQVTKPAFIFAGDQWASLKSFPDGIAACTVLLVARLRHPKGALRSGIVESYQSGADTTQQADVILRLKNNHVRAQVKGHHREELLFETHRPVIVGASHASDLSRLIQVGSHTRIHHFHHPAISSFDMTLLLGRLGGTYDADTTTVMDLLEVNLWQSALDGTALRKAAHQLNGIYGITG